MKNTHIDTYINETHIETSMFSIRPIVQSFFELLDKEEISWAVLRGGDELPEHTRYDIDLLLEVGGIPKAVSALDRIAAVHGWQNLIITDKFNYRCCLLISPGPKYIFLPIDLLEGCFYRFYPTSDSGYALQHRKKNDRGVWEVPPGFCAAEALVKELMRHDSFKINSRAEVQAGALLDPTSFNSGVKSYLGENLTDRLITACQAGEWKFVEELAPEIRRNIRTLRAFSLVMFTKFLWKNFSHHIKPRMSLFVVLLGPDGSGKSTVGDIISEQLYHHPFKVCCRFEHKFKLLPELKQYKIVLGKLFSRKVSIVPPPVPGTKGSGMNKDHNLFWSVLYITYYLLDFILGHILLLRLRGQGGLIVFARYFYDYYYQRGYGRAPRWYLRLIERLVPTPDLILYLDRQPEEIYEGKPELDLLEIKRQQMVIRELIKDRKNTHIVNASDGIEKTVQNVSEILLSRFLAKAVKHDSF